MPSTRRIHPYDQQLRSRSRAPLGSRTGSLTSRTYIGHIDRTNNLTTSVYAAGAQIIVGVMCASQRTASRSQSRSRSRALFGARSFFPTRRSRPESINFDEDHSPKLGISIIKAIWVWVDRLLATHETDLTFLSSITT